MPAATDRRGPDPARDPAPEPRSGLGPMVPHPYRVRRRQRELPDTVTLTLEPAGAGGVPARWVPGQFNMLYAFGVGEVPISISGESGPGLVHTVRAVGAVSRALCAARPGDVLGVRGPFGTGWELEATGPPGGDVVVVAGGIGLAPLRPLVYQLLAQRDRYREVSVLVGARTPDTLLFQRELHAWRSRFDLRVEVTVDHAERGWLGHVGVVTELLGHAVADPARTAAFVCGPEVMLRLTATALADQGVAPAAIRVSLERNMKCAVGHCGHCQLGPVLVCRDGAVFGWDRVARLLSIRGL